MTDMSSSVYVDCYNCTGSNTRSMCGMPMLGCLLCQTHGKGFGSLLQEYRNKPVEIATKNGIIKFTPPAYSCLTCKDSKRKKMMVYDKDKLDNGCSDACHNMPMFEVACYACCGDAHHTELEEAKAAYFCGRDGGNYI